MKCGRLRSSNCFVVFFPPFPGILPPPSSPRPRSTVQNSTTLSSSLPPFVLRLSRVFPFFCRYIPRDVYQARALSSPLGTLVAPSFDSYSASFLISSFLPRVLPRSPLPRDPTLSRFCPRRLSIGVPRDSLAVSSELARSRSLVFYERCTDFFRFRFLFFSLTLLPSVL